MLRGVDDAADAIADEATGPCANNATLGGTGDSTRICTFDRPDTWGNKSAPCSAANPTAKSTDDGARRSADAGANRRGTC